MGLSKSKNSDSKQKLRVENDEGVKNHSCKRKLPKPDVENSKEISSKQSGSDINGDSNFQISNTLTVEQTILARKLFEHEVESLGSMRLSISAPKKQRPCTGSNFSKMPIVSEISEIISPVALDLSKTAKDPKPIKTE